MRTTFPQIVVSIVRVLTTYGKNNPSRLTCRVQICMQFCPLACVMESSLIVYLRNARYGSYNSKSGLEEALDSEEIIASGPLESIGYLINVPFQFLFEI